MRAPIVTDQLHYFAEVDSPEQEFSGPFAAIVTAVHPQAEDGSHRVELLVFPPGVAVGKTKSSVLLTDSPTKHCCSWPERP